MRNFILIVLTFSLLNLCSTNQGHSKQTGNNKSENNLQGFVVVDISKIYHHNGEITIVDNENDTILHAENKTFAINGEKYETIDEEYLYKKHLNVESYDAEYGIFILKCYGLIDGFYQVKIDGQICLISKDRFKEYIEFKNFEQYVMGTYPIPTQNNPLRITPNDTSEILKEFDIWTFVPVEIRGDWVKVKDDKDCYSGPIASKEDIVGWIRWRKDGKFILKVAYVC
ncbi:MAG: hypothetical protein JEY97_09095 [Bacteroidales bacterium]|nr:hypothetical protein [Bacteroidales bacterium]